MSDRGQQDGPQGWKRTTLGEALPIHYGKARNEKYGTVREDTPVYGSSGRIDTFDRALTGGPSLIIGRKGTVGATYYCTEPCWPIDTVYFTEAPADEDLRFFKYLLDHLQLARMDRSTAVPGLSRDDYNATEVFIPELDQQLLIVAEIEKQFSRLDEAVANLKRIKANLKRYKASVLKAAVEGKLTEDWRKQHPNVEPASKLLERILADRRVKRKDKGTYKEPIAPDTSNVSPLPQGWTWASVDQVAEVSLGKMLDQNKHRAGRRLPYLRNVNVRWGRVQTEDLLEMFFESDELGRYGLKPGDVLVCEGGEPGRAAVWDGRIPELKYQKALHRVRFYGTIEPRYLVFLLEFLADTGRLERWFTGSTIKHFTRESFISLPIQMPSLKEQGQIVAEVERRLSVIDELEATVEANLTRADRLRQSVLSQAFKGNLIQ